MELDLQNLEDFSSSMDRIERFFGISFSWSRAGSAPQIIDQMFKILMFKCSTLVNKSASDTIAEGFIDEIDQFISGWNDVVIPSIEKARLGNTSKSVLLLKMMQNFRAFSSFSSAAIRDSDIDGKNAIVWTILVVVLSRMARWSFVLLAKFSEFLNNKENLATHALNFIRSTTFTSVLIFQKTISKINGSQRLSESCELLQPLNQRLLNEDKTLFRDLLQLACYSYNNNNPFEVEFISSVFDCNLRISVLWDIILFISSERHLIEDRIREEESVIICKIAARAVTRDNKSERVSELHKINNIKDAFYDRFDESLHDHTLIMSKNITDLVDNLSQRNVFLPVIFAFWENYSDLLKTMISLNEMESLFRMISKSVSLSEIRLCFSSSRSFSALWKLLESCDQRTMKKVIARFIRSFPSSSLVIQDGTSASIKDFVFFCGVLLILVFFSKMPLSHNFEQLLDLSKSSHFAWTILYQSVVSSVFLLHDTGASVLRQMINSIANFTEKFIIKVKHSTEVAIADISNEISTWLKETRSLINHQAASFTSEDYYMLFVVNAAFLDCSFNNSEFLYVHVLNLLEDIMKKLSPSQLYRAANDVYTRIQKLIAVYSEKYSLEEVPIIIDACTRFTALLTINIGLFKPSEVTKIFSKYNSFSALSKTSLFATRQVCLYYHVHLFSLLKGDELFLKKLDKHLALKLICVSFLGILEPRFSLLSVFLQNLSRLSSFWPYLADFLAVESLQICTDEHVSFESRLHIVKNCLQKLNESQFIVSELLFSLFLRSRSFI